MIRSLFYSKRILQNAKFIKSYFYLVAVCTVASHSIPPSPKVIHPFRPYYTLGEANTLAALSRLHLDTDPTTSQQLLERALTLRRMINARYDEGADLGNYGIALLQRGRNAQALPYLQQAQAVFAVLEIAHLVEMMDRLIAQASAGG